MVNQNSVYLVNLGRYMSVAELEKLPDAKFEELIEKETVDRFMFMSYDKINQSRQTKKGSKLLKNLLMLKTMRNSATKSKALVAECSSLLDKENNCQLNKLVENRRAKSAAYKTRFPMEDIAEEPVNNNITHKVSCLKSSVQFSATARNVKSVKCTCGREVGDIHVSDGVLRNNMDTNAPNGLFILTGDDEIHDKVIEYAVLDGFPRSKFHNELGAFEECTEAFVYYEEQEEMARLSPESRPIDNHFFEMRGSSQIIHLSDIATLTKLFGLKCENDKENTLDVDGPNPEKCQTESPTEILLLSARDTDFDSNCDNELVTIIQNESHTFSHQNDSDDSGSYSESDNDENTFRKRKHSPVQVCVDDDFNKKRMLQKQQYQPLVIA